MTPAEPLGFPITDPGTPFTAQELAEMLFHVQDDAWENLSSWTFGRLSDPPRIETVRTFLVWAGILTYSRPSEAEFASRDELSPEETVLLLRDSIPDAHLEAALQKVREHAAAAPAIVPTIERPFAQLRFLAAAQRLPPFDVDAPSPTPAQ